MSLVYLFMHTIYGVRRIIIDRQFHSAILILIRIKNAYVLILLWEKSRSRSVGIFPEIKKVPKTCSLDIYFAEEY